MRETAGRKGVSPLVSYVMITGIVIAATGIILSAGMPMLENMRDTASIQQAIETLTEMDSAIREVASGGKFTTKSFTVRNRRGEYIFDEEDNSIYYEIESDSGIISPQTSREIGPVILSANTGVEVYETVLNSTKCYMMENQHLKACIRKVTDGFNPSAEKRVKGFWRMNQEGFQAVEDSSQYNINGTRGETSSADASDPSWGEGVFDTGLVFDGDNDFVRFNGDMYSFEPSDNFTVSAWFRKTDSEKGEIVQRSSGSAGNWFIRASNTLMCGAVDLNSHEIRISSAKTVDDGEWHHALLSFNNRTLSCYLDGKLVDQEENPSLDSSLYSSENVDMGLGVKGRDYSMPFNGTIDEVKVFNQALSSREVEWEYLKNGDERYINNSRLLVYYFNKNLRKEMTPETEIVLNSLKDTVSGQGYTEAETLSQNLGSGRIVARVNSVHGFRYEILFDLVSGSDFLKVEVR